MVRAQVTAWSERRSQAGASEITGEEYEAAWDRYVAANPGFAGTA